MGEAPRVPMLRLAAPVLGGPAAVKSDAVAQAAPARHHAARGNAVQHGTWGWMTRKLRTSVVLRKLCNEK